VIDPGTLVRVLPTCDHLRPTGVTGRVTANLVLAGLVGVAEFSAPCQSRTQLGWQVVDPRCGVWINDSDLEVIGKVS
jgi:hypothetical protein